MPMIAFTILAVAVLVGSGLAVQHLRPNASVPWPLAALHALLGVGGLCLLVPVLWQPPRGAAMGMASFGLISVILLASAALVGAGVLARQRFKGRRSGGGLIGLHATLAISGFVILAAYLFVG